MSRYSGHSGSGTGSGNNNEDYDDKTLKLQKYSALRVTLSRVAAADTTWGDRFIPGFEDAAVMDGIVFERDDNPDTWKIFGFGDLGFNVGPDGLVYEGYDAEADEYTGEMSAQDVLDHARVQGFQETFGGDTYWYTPVGVVVEEGDDVAVNTDLIEQPEATEIPIGDASMLLGNKSWARTLAKLVTESGDDIIAKETNEAGNTVPSSDDHGWLTTDDPQLREQLEGREVELFIIEESFETDDGEEVEYTTPILMDSKTGERITLDNGDDEGEPTNNEAGQDAAEDYDEPAADPTPTATTDGGTTTADVSDSDTESPAEPSMDAEFPEAVEDLIGYFARSQGSATPDELREFAEGEVDDLDAIDWDAAAAEVENQA